MLVVVSLHSEGRSNPLSPTDTTQTEVLVCIDLYCLMHTAGWIINDSHAEIITRRAFLRYVLQAHSEDHCHKMKAVYGNNNTIDVVMYCN